MIYSMTAFSRSELSADWGQLTWELRSVNHRYLEPSFKLPEQLRQIEATLRDRLRKKLARGKVDCFARLSFNTAQAATIQLDTDRAQAVFTACRSLTELGAAAQPPSAMQLLGWPGVQQEPEQNIDAIAAQALSSFDRALADLISVRAGEGTALQQMIDQRLHALGEQVTVVQQAMPELLAGQRQKLQEKLAELQLQPDQDRLEQELVYLAQKADVEEEMDRLQAHIAEITKVLSKGGACGRRLDFLMQELNREANTLSSKSISSITTLAGVEMKVLIEQMREQIQNIE